MRIKLWGARGSLSSFGPENLRYGGNTSCVSVETGDDALVLDAGSGIRRLGQSMKPKFPRIDILLTHLHMDHIQGLGFFGPLFDPELEVHVWGPPSATLTLSERLNRYLSPPLFPLRLREIPSQLTCHDVPRGSFAVGPFRVTADFVCHPGPTVGYRIEGDGVTLVYIPDHEPALGSVAFPCSPAWTSGYCLARDADLLVHDSQYAVAEYGWHVGWGHSSLRDATRFADLCGARRLVTFHHDPSHADDEIDRLASESVARSCEIVPGREGDVITV
jgi:phosphoribosyl 1,2-cyclic phosphodiesterase